MMHIHARIEVGMRLKVTHRTSKQLAPLLVEAFAPAIGEPLPPRAASRAVLACAVRIHFDSHGASSICLFSAVAIDFAAQVVGLPSIHTTGFAPALRLDLAQAFKQEHTAWILGAYVDNAARHHFRSIVIHALHVPPQLLIAVLSLDR